ncbi:hypothetical protein CSUB01_07851 [Colletotrichum sublineola]|uniref:Uncharacterized protein n=1 Tax=Colletotrichum sublineola TaxID=1173701 RepID=A0A066XLZ7_COLSU|nr:hypothetical protein CSUB01_07851 [Colletotrichum sublineola]
MAGRLRSAAPVSFSIGSTAVAVAPREVGIGFPFTSSPRAAFSSTQSGERQGKMPRCMLPELLRCRTPRLISVIHDAKAVLFRKINTIMTLARENPTRGHGKRRSLYISRRIDAHTVPGSVPCAWTEQIWANMVRNCDILGEERIITPFINLTEVELPPDTGPGKDWDLCPSTATVSPTNEGFIWEFAQKASLPMACVRYFNPTAYYTPESLRGRRLCLPLTCETVVVDETTNIQDFVEKKLEGVVMYQFLE